ncbi:MAG: molybdopterin-dependent oxidoreductase [Actinomycetota bacterium]
MRVVRTACRGCHGVCRVLVHMDGDRVVKVTGDPESPTSRGYLCPKGAAAPDLLYHPDRVTHPLRRRGPRGSGDWERVSWDEALGEITERLEALRSGPGTEYFGMAQGTGRPYTNFTSRFAHAYGTPNFTGVAHLCYMPRWLASVHTLGQLPICDFYGFGGTMPRCIVIWGCNVTETGASDGMCGGTVERALKQAEKVIVVDPRRIKPAREADHWLQLRPGTDGALALAMINTIIGEGLWDREFVEGYTTGFEELAGHVEAFTPEWAAPITGLEADSIRDAARAYATCAPAAMLWGNAVDMSACNYQTARSLLILRAITGNIDRPGGDVLWVPPEGVRQRSLFMNLEVAGLQFLPSDKVGQAVDAGTYPLCAITHAPTFWRSIATGDPYRMRALWIVGSNPLLTQTHTDDIERALDALEFTVVSDFFLTPTAEQADLFLPAATWLEQDDVANLHKIWCVLARKAVARLGEVRDDRDVMIELAHRLGLDEAFPWQDLRSYFDWVLEGTGLDFDEFCERGILMGEMRYHKYRESGFVTPTGKLELRSTILEAMGLEPLPVYREPPNSPVSTPDLAREYPLVLTTGAKIRGFFHSEGRQIERPRRANPEPLVELHPETASDLGIADGDRVLLETPEGSVEMVARLTDGIRRDTVCAQHAWWFPEEQPPDYGRRRSGVNALFGDTEYDPDTGSEPLKCSLCRVRKAH